MKTKIKPKTLIEILQPYNSIAIAGMAKNAGKTTALNHMICGFAAQGTTLGLTSIGLDGEEVDHVTATPKPRIYVPAGTIIATAEKLLTKREQGINDISRQILAVMDDFTTPLGRIVVARALSAGNVMLAGASMARQIAPLTRILRDWGAAKIIIDGAVGRKSLAMPEIAEAVVLAVGAGLARSMDAVIAETCHTVDIFCLPHVGASCARPLSKPYVYMEGAITDSKLDGLYDRHVVAEDATKILIGPKALAKLRLSGGTLSVKKRINLVAVTINPTSPYGAGFDAAEFFVKMQQAINVPVFDIVGASCARPRVR
ncbi:MAG: hypothetical protein LBE55_01915 [Clostridiales bacterium]|jgi:hypothetical protein|nr:hypothetical protein [Clostridiales bacterium]